MKRVVLVMAAVCLAASAQEKQEKKEIQHFQIRIDGPAAGAQDQVFVRGVPGPTMHIQRFEAKAVKGRPYAAEAATESIQTLADGNRIINRSNSKMYRDAEGRTRIENTIAPNAMWVPQGGREIAITMIDDPVAGVHYTLNSNDKTATKVSIPKPPPPPAAGMSAGKVTRIERDVVVHSTGAVAGPMPPGGAGPAVMVFETREDLPMKVSSGAGVKRELLGKQTIEGVECEGTRETFVIPAGQMGNEREIRSVTERWYSNELGFDVLRKHSDPRTGETTYRVTNIVRADQPRSLFEVPADYKLEEVDTKAGPVSEEVVIKHRTAKE